MKHKSETLPPDKAINENIQSITAIGHYTNTEQIKEYTRNLIFRKLLMQGYEYNTALEAVEEHVLTQRTMLEMYALLNFTNWYYGGRQIYRFDDTLAETLSSQTKDLPIDTIVLDQLPCTDFFVMRNYGNNIGFFINIENGESYTIVFTELRKDYKMNSWKIPVKKGMSIQESLTELLSEENSKVWVKNNKDTILQDVEIFAEKFQYLLYLSAVNAEVTPVTKGAVVKKVSSNNTSRTTTNKPKSEVSNVGYKIGAAIRSVRTEKERIVYIHDGNVQRQGTPKSPHVRRSHFHSYWTGNGDNKQLVVKWINTIFVKGSSEDLANTSTLHDIK